MSNQRLFMVLVGCRPKGRHTEQHDVFFGIAESITDLKPAMNKFWPGSGGLHIDAWREVTQVDDFKISIAPKDSISATDTPLQLYFINLGGYVEHEFDELHHKLLVVAPTMSAAIKVAKQTAFFKQKCTTTLAGAAHIDDKFGFAIDEVLKVNSILPLDQQQHFELSITESVGGLQDAVQLGYLKFSKL
jgi:Domain of Unknown Function (DUF1543)